MITVKHKDIIDLAQNPYVTDITESTQVEANRHLLDCVARSERASYGFNGAVFIGKESGKVYVITEGNSLLAKII